MVQNENSTVDEGTTLVVPENPAKGISTGKYRLVGWGIDTTGSRLIDEIIQIASYTPESKFSQYIMPFNDIKPVFINRHGISIVNSVRYRRLLDLNSNEYVKTKSEISALQVFVQWLEKVKGEDADGIILVYYEVRKASPGMFLESLKRHNLLDRFSRVVKGFANAYNITQAKCANTTKSFSLRVMSKVLLNRDNENFGSAVERARASFDITAHLAQSERVELEKENPLKGYTGLEPHIITFVCPFSNSIEDEEEEIAVFKVLLERQNTFRPVFGALMRSSRRERLHASRLRRLLAENNISYEKLKEAYESGAKEGLETVITNEVANAKEKDLEELLNILDCFFDPEKKAIEPKRNYIPYNRRRSKSFNRNRNKNSQSSENRSPNTSIGKSSTDNQTNVSNTSSPRSDTEKAAIEIEKTEDVAAENTAVAAQ